jgi:hypothetical protein
VFGAPPEPGLVFPFATVVGGFALLAWHDPLQVGIVCGPCGPPRAKLVSVAAESIKPVAAASTARLRVVLMEDINSPVEVVGD